MKLRTAIYIVIFLLRFSILFVVILIQIIPFAWNMHLSSQTTLMLLLYSC